MDNYIDEKEKRYIEAFGEPELVAHDVIDDPHVDIYIFKDTEKNIFYYLTKGMEEADFIEYFMISKENHKWPVYLLQAICDYQLAQEKELLSGETLETGEVMDVPEKYPALILLGDEHIDIDLNEWKEKLELQAMPLCAFLITKKELAFKLENNAAALLEKLLTIESFPASQIDRESVV